MDIIREENQKNPIAVGEKLTPYTKDDFLSEVYMTSEKYDALKGLLYNKRILFCRVRRGSEKHLRRKDWHIRSWVKRRFKSGTDTASSELFL